MNEHRACSHQWQDEATRGQFVGDALSVAPYIDPGNWQAMQPGHTSVCVSHVGVHSLFPTHRARTNLTIEVPSRQAMTLSATRQRSAAPMSPPPKGLRWSPDCRS